MTYQKPNELYSACPDVYNFVIRMVNQYCPSEDYNTFDSADYAMRYPDVQAAIGTNKKSCGIIIRHAARMKAVLQNSSRKEEKQWIV